MAMSPDILKELQKDVPSARMQALLRKCLDLVKLSRDKMCERYEEWDRHDFVYQGYKTQDSEDKKSDEKKQPTKMTVPITHSQVQTFVAFAFSVLFQREQFFDLTPYSVENTKGEKVGEALLQRDLDYNNFYQKTYQFMLDAARFGLAVFKNYWFEDVQMVRQTSQPISWNFLGVSGKFGGGKVSYRRQVNYQGNKICNVSPYRWFPDPRFPITEFQKGEFCASEDEYSYASLKTLQNEGVVAGLEFVHTLQKSADENLKAGRRLNLVREDSGKRLLMEAGTGSVVTEIELVLVPSETFITDDDEPLGPEDFPVKYLVWYINDERIIRLEVLDYPHNKFTYTAGEFSPDMTHFLNDGLAGTIDVLQDVISWFVNSHISSVRKIIQNKIVFDPEAVEFEDIKQNRPGIRIKKGANRQGIDTYIKQLQLQDVTGQHMEDANTLHGVIQIVTGINDNALGQFNTGRRSATEAKNVFAGAAARLKMIVQLLYYSAYEPLGRQMLANLRRGLTLPTYVKVFGLAKDPTLEGYFQFTQVTNKDLIGEYDFEIMDGTLPSEKAYMAQTLTELTGLLLQDPMLALMTGYDIGAIIQETLELRGIRHPERLKMSQTKQSVLMSQIAISNLTQNAGGQNGNRQEGNSAAGGNRNGAPAATY